MKLLKVEKWWLIVGILTYIGYNIPGLPAYGDVKGAIIWNIGFFAIFWITNYAFNAKICKIYKPRKTTEEFLAENAAADRATAELIAAEEAAEKAAKGRN